MLCNIIHSKAKNEYTTPKQYTKLNLDQVEENNLVYEISMKHISVNTLKIYKLLRFPTSTSLDTSFTPLPIDNTCG